MERGSGEGSSAPSSRETPDAPQETSAAAPNQNPGPSLEALAPLVLVLATAPWLYFFAKHYTSQPLFRDPGMFQYVGWCLRHGERLYDTVSMPDGPFIHFWHAFLQTLGGTTDRAFRTIDLLVHIVGGGLLGAALRPRTGSRPILVTAVWAALGTCLWLTYIFAFYWSDSSQREMYYALFGTLGLATAFAVITAERPSRSMLVLAGVLCAAPALGKHTGLVYPALAALSLFVARRQAKSWRDAWRWFFTGVGGAVLVALVLVAIFGSLRGFVYWHYVYALEVYRFIHSVPLDQVFLGMDPARGFPLLAVLATGGGLVAIATRLLSPAAVGLVLAPSLQFLSGVMQGKGWGYQFHPAVAGAFAVLLLALGRVSECKPSAANPVLRAGAIWVAFTLTLAYCVRELQQSPWRKPEDAANSPEVVTRQKVAELLRARTPREARVLYYGIDPYTLYLAERRPAIPQLVSFMVNFSVPTAKSKTSAAQRARIGQLERAAAADVCQRFRAHAPAAIVAATSPPNTGPDALQDLAQFCPEIGVALRDRYERVADIGGTAVFLARP